MNTPGAWVRPLLLLTLAAAPGLMAAPALAAEFAHFITVDGTEDGTVAGTVAGTVDGTVDRARLMDGPEEFRFVGFNVPTLFYVEDEMAFTQTNPYGLPTEFELRDLYQTVVEMGGRVVRAYTVPVRNRAFPPESVTYVEAPGVFNEEAFQAMDLALALAAEYGVRVIIPLVNNWQWMGGRPNYAEFRGLPADAFWTDQQLIADFKQTIDFVLNRENTRTGTRYRDDKTILAWETGNELHSPAAWAVEIGRYIKRIDPNHLLIDGSQALRPEDGAAVLQAHLLEEPSLDLISTHHYETSPADMLANLQRTVGAVDGRKPLLLGEFGFISTSGFEAVLDYVIGEPRIPGALIWSLRRHHERGGFYHHSEPAGFGLYRAYHWPGFDDGEPYDERRVLRLIRAKAFAIQGKPVPPISAPRAPQLLPFSGAPVFSWRGSMGAAAYDIERSESAGGPWRRLAWGVDDIDAPGFPLFSDVSAAVGASYHYRAFARNESGQSPPSNVVGPVEVEFLTLTDKARNLAVLYESSGVEVRRGEYRSFKEAHSRLHGAKGGHVTYRAPGRPLEIRLYVFEQDTEPDLALFESRDGSAWVPAAAEARDFASGESNYDYRVPVGYRYAPRDAAVRYLKAVFGDSVDIVRVELDYR
jgi:hypothetical protein